MELALASAYKKNFDSKTNVRVDVNRDTGDIKVFSVLNVVEEISEEDFKLRGHGDLFGTKQSGDMAFKIANVRNDYKILLQAKKDSKEYLLNKDTDKDELKLKLINSITKG